MYIYVMYIYITYNIYAYITVYVLQVINTYITHSTCTCHRTSMLVIGYGSWQVFAVSVIRLRRQRIMRV